MEETYFITKWASCVERAPAINAGQLIYTGSSDRTRRRGAVVHVRLAVVSREPGQTLTGVVLGSLGSAGSSILTGVACTNLLGVLTARTGEMLGTRTF